MKYFVLKFATSGKVGISYNVAMSIKVDTVLKIEIQKKKNFTIKNRRHT